MKTDLIIHLGELTFGETRKIPPKATFEQIQEFEKYLANIDVSEAFDVIFDIESVESPNDPVSEKSETA